MESLLELKNISKAFPGVQALTNAYFEVRAGEVHALLGENGAGKSTLIKIISGLYKQDEGEMLLDGQGVVFNNPREAQAGGIATIYQELSLYPELTVAENIFMGHAPRNRLGMVDWGKMREQARRILVSLNIHNVDVNEKVGAMTVGKRQRVEIAKALSMNARILIMDEPTAALTESDVKTLFEIVRLLRERGVAIIYISHRLEEVFELADRVSVLRDGQYVGTKLVPETNENELIGMMVGRTIDVLFPKLRTEIGAPMLQAENIARRPDVRNVSLTVHSGEIVGLAGLVGSGRSEFAQVVFGISPAESGSLRLNGKEVHVKSPAEAMKLGIAYVPEDRGTQGLIRQMNIRENVSLAVLRSLVKRGFIDRKGERSLADSMIEKLSIRAFSSDQIVNKLSGGNQQKVVVSKWLASEPRLLIMDEPTRGIDVGAKAEIHRLISVLAEQGLAILMISSELPEIMGMSDRILVMREGSIVAEFKRENATQEQIAAAMMSEGGAQTYSNSVKPIESAVL